MLAAGGGDTKDIKPLRCLARAFSGHGLWPFVGSLAAKPYTSRKAERTKAPVMVFHVRRFSWGRGSLPPDGGAILGFCPVWVSFACLLLCPLPRGLPVSVTALMPGAAHVQDFGLKAAPLVVADTRHRLANGLVPGLSSGWRVPAARRPPYFSARARLLPIAVFSDRSQG